MLQHNTTRHSSRIFYFICGWSLASMQKHKQKLYQYIKDCEAGAGRTPLFRKRKYFSAFLKGMTGALIDNPF